MSTLVGYTTMERMSRLCAMWALAALLLILCVALAIVIGLWGVAIASFLLGVGGRIVADPFLRRRRPHP